jgi:hypothetical protein
VRARDAPLAQDTTCDTIASRWKFDDISLMIDILLDVGHAHWRGSTQMISLICDKSVTTLTGYYELLV